VAGLFYPDDPVALERAVEQHLGADREDGAAIAIVAPHAGYVYSGAIAGDVYRRIRVPRVAIVLCPNHTGDGARAAVMSTGAWKLPGFSLPIEEALAEELRDVALLTEDARAHAREHSLEVHLPFLRARNPQVHFVPVCLANLPYDSCVRIGHALADVITRHGRDVLVVASTDMSHYLPAEVAAKQDRQALDRITALDAEHLYKTVRDQDISMCGVIPTTVALVAAQALGARTSTLTRYGHSGETSGDLQRVVGYAGFVIA
jgi:MEMO1 family protein